MTRKTFDFDATVTSVDGVTDKITITLEYPEDRAAALLGFLENFHDQREDVQQAILMANLDDASIMTMIARANDAGYLD